MIGKHHRMFCTDEFSKSKQYKDFWKCLAEGKIQSGEFQRIKNGGEELWINASYTPVIDERGKVSKVIKIAADITGMISGIGITMLYVFQHKGIMFIPGTSFLGDMGPNWFFGISPNAFGAVGALVNFGVAFAMLQVTGPAPKHIQELVENMRIPSGVTAAHDH